MRLLTSNDVRSGGGLRRTSVLSVFQPWGYQPWPLASSRPIAAKFNRNDHPSVTNGRNVSRWACSLAFGGIESRVDQPFRGGGVRLVAVIMTGNAPANAVVDWRPKPTALVHPVDAPGGTEQRATRVPAPADGADALAEPQRRVGIHGPVRTGRVGGTSLGERIPRADLGPLPHGVGAVRYPAPRRPNVVPQGLQAAECLAGTTRTAALRRGRPNRHRLGEQPAGGPPRRRVYGVQRGHHPCAAGRIAAAVDRAGRGPQRDQPIPRRQAAQQAGGAVLHGIVGHLADGVDRAGARRAHRQARHHLGPDRFHCHAKGFRDEKGARRGGRLQAGWRGGGARDRHSGCDAACAGAEPAPVDSRRPVPLRPQGPAAEPSREGGRRGLQLCRVAHDRRRQ